MRVLITNSLVLAAISLAPAASAAPYTTTTSSVDTLEAYPNSTVFTHNSGPSSVPNARRDEIIRVQSLYDQSSAFGNVFKPIADLFGTMGMNTISDKMPLTEAQIVALGQLHDALNNAAGNVIAQFPANHPPSPLSSRSLEDHQVPNPLSTLGSLSVLSDPLDRLSDLLSSVGITSNLATLDGPQKQVIADLRTAITKAVGDVAADVSKSSVLPFNHQGRSIEERSLGNIVSAIDLPPLRPFLEPLTSFIDHFGILNETPLSDVQMQAMSRFQDAVAKAVQEINTDSTTVHIQHTREEYDHRDHHDDHRGTHKDDHNPHDQAGDRRKPHDEHKDHDKSWDEHQEPSKPWEEHKDTKWSRDAHEGDHRPHDVQKDDHRPHDAHRDDHKDGHDSPGTHWDDRNAHSAHREGDHCREPRDGQWAERYQWHDCKHHKDGKDGEKDSSLIKIDLGHSHHP